MQTFNTHAKWTHVRIKRGVSIHNYKFTFFTYWKGLHNDL